MPYGSWSVGQLIECSASSRGTVSCRCIGACRSHVSHALMVILCRRLYSRLVIRTVEDFQEECGGEQEGVAS